MTLSLRGLTRRMFITGLVAAPFIMGPGRVRALQLILNECEAMQQLRGILIAHGGEIIIQRAYQGADIRQPTAIKSASKSIISAMVGIAIERGLIQNEDQKMADFLEHAFPENPDPRLYDITIAHLLSMRAGLNPLSGPDYGRFAHAEDKIRFTLAQSFVDKPGGEMLYSTASTHLLAVILAKAGGKSTYALAKEWFAGVRDFSIAAWAQDTQGYYIGGNEMAMTPRSMLAFGELYRRGGVSADAKQIIPLDWIRKSWHPYTASPDTGHAYGYGWYLVGLNGHDIKYAWGHGGQMIFVVPDLDLTIVMTSDPTQTMANANYGENLMAVLADIVSYFEA